MMGTTAHILSAQNRASSKTMIKRWCLLMWVVGLVAMLATLVVFTLLVATPLVLNSTGCVLPAISSSFSVSPLQASPSAKEFSIIMGVFSTASRVERRNIIRLAYGMQSTDIANVTVRFIIGRPMDRNESLQIGLESHRYGDIIVLDMDENMNAGKTWRFFSTVFEMGVRYDYVMKVDDDSYVRINNLASSLAEESRTDLYYGYILPCANKNPYWGYMAGMGYVITWDLIEWISTSEIVLNKTGGYQEDRMTADWFNEGKKAKHRVSKKPLFYDHPQYMGKNRCPNELVPETILIHQMKSTELWMDVLQHFEGGRFSLNGSTAVGNGSVALS
ncbi:hypothetical protein KC19_11G022600 [Ceratodon purpureus]|uniref:Hexosyltransferase n=1 Tax=Ceratodon purpureus TaxID=3225 RepID=A0A8T0GAF2_CERPU|nr:hypothetical protein KC19_11G022600 [Ceratodon purpureus]